MKGLNDTRLLRLLGLMCCLPLLACGASEVSYVSRGDLQHDSLYLASKSEAEHKPTSYGAVKFRAEDAMPDEGRLFMLQKKKGVYQAETLVSDKNDKRYYFSVGMNYKNQMPMVGLRIEF